MELPQDHRSVLDIIIDQNNTEDGETRQIGTSAKRKSDKEIEQAYEAKTLKNLVDSGVSAEKQRKNEQVEVVKKGRNKAVKVVNDTPRHITKRSQDETYVRNDVQNPRRRTYAEVLCSKGYQ